MALRLIERPSEKRAAQRQLHENLSGALANQGIKSIGYQGGNTSHRLYSNGVGTMWYAAAPPSRDSPVPRYWNSFGIYQPGAGSQTIIVETSVPLSANTASVAGFFARDVASGDVILMHSGKIGGGRPGVGKGNFFAWAAPSLVDVEAADGRIRSAVALGSVRGSDLADRIWRYVKQVAAFKEAAVAGELNTREFRSKAAVYKRYSKEFSGRKRGHRSAALDYVTYHNDVVDEAARLRAAALSAGEQIVKTNLIDLGVLNGASLVELYEVKTSCDRQSLYAGIGQLITHSCGQTGCRLFLIIPADEPVPQDVKAALRQQRILTRTYRLNTKAKKQVVSLTL
jgi:ribosomal protein L21